MILKSLEGTPGLRSQGYITPDIPFSINILHVEYLGDEEVLVSATDAGYVCLWYTSRFEKPNHDGLPDMHFDVEKSAWGLSIHRKKRLLAVSSNAQTVYVFELGITGVNGNAAGGARNPIKVRGLRGNIPSISFLQEDPSGRWICATTITGRTQLIDLWNQRRCIPHDKPQPGWSVQFLSEDVFKWTKITNPAFILSSKSTGIMFDEYDVMGNAHTRNDFYATHGGHTPSCDKSTMWSSVEGQIHSQVLSEAFGVIDDRYKDNFFLRSYMDNLPETRVCLRQSDEVSGGMHSDMTLNKVSVIRPDFRTERPGTRFNHLDESSSLLRFAKLQKTRAELMSYPPHATIFIFGINDMMEFSTQPILHGAMNGSWSYVNNYPTSSQMFPHAMYDLQVHRSWACRLNLSLVIPSLSLLVVASQNGRVALLRLLRTEPRSEDGYSIITEKQEPTCFTYREWNIPRIPPAPYGADGPMLLGICASPMQGWQRSGRKKKRRGATMGIQNSEDHVELWRLVLIYTNGMTRTYELSNGNQTFSPYDDSDSDTISSSNSSTWTDNTEE